MRNFLAALSLAQAGAMAMAQPVFDGGKAGYADFELETKKLHQQGLRFDVPSIRTWAMLGEADKSGFLEAMKTIDGSKFTAAQKSNAMNNLAAKADLRAVEALARSGRYPNISLPPSAGIDSSTLGDWKKLGEKKEESSLDLQSAALLAKYRVDIERFPQWPYDTDPRRFPTEPKLRIQPKPVEQEPAQLRPRRRPELEMGTAGTPEAMPPGAKPPQTISNQIVASLSKNRVGGAIGAYTVSDAQIAHGDAVKVTDDRRSDPFNPIGFLEVVKIEHKVVTLSCSGTLISDTLVLTAKHCANESRVQDLLVMVPRWDQKEYERCLTAKEKKEAYRHCVGFDEHKLALTGGIRLHPNKDVDLALLKLAEPASTENRTFAKVNFDSTRPTKISAAGYGDGRVLKSPESQRALDVGWYSGEFDLIDGKMAWRPRQQRGDIVSCRGDSGGPIFKGVHTGYNLDQKPRELIAVISGTPGKQQECGADVVTQTSLAALEVSTWLCNQSDVPANICPNSKYATFIFLTPPAVYGNSTNELVKFLSPKQ